MNLDNIISFCFYTENEHIRRKIDDNTFLRIVRLDDNIAEMSFVDSEENRFYVPNDIIVLNSMTMERVPLYSNTQTFFLSWSESYNVTMQIQKNWRTWYIDSFTHLIQ